MMSHLKDDYDTNKLNINSDIKIRTAITLLEKIKELLKSKNLNGSEKENLSIFFDLFLQKDTSSSVAQKLNHNLLHDETNTGKKTFNVFDYSKIINVDELLSIYKKFILSESVFITETYKQNTNSMERYKQISESISRLNKIITQIDDIIITTSDISRTLANYKTITNSEKAINIITGKCDDSKLYGLPNQIKILDTIDKLTDLEKIKTEKNNLNQLMLKLKSTISSDIEKLYDILKNTIKTIESVNDIYKNMQFVFEIEPIMEKEQLDIAKQIMKGGDYKLQDFIKNVNDDMNLSSQIKDVYSEYVITSTLFKSRITKMYSAIKNASSNLLNTIIYSIQKSELYVYVCSNDTYNKTDQIPRYVPLSQLKKIQTTLVNIFTTKLSNSVYDIIKVNSLSVLNNLIVECDVKKISLESCIDLIQTSHSIELALCIYLVKKYE